MKKLVLTLTVLTLFAGCSKDGEKQFSDSITRIARNIAEIMNPGMEGANPQRSFHFLSDAEAVGKVQWSTTLAGKSPNGELTAPVVYNGRLYLRLRSDDFTGLMVLDAETGVEQWRFPVAPASNTSASSPI